MKGFRGFTLLELLMVVIIIGILASIALPQYLRVTERSRSSEALQNLAAIRASEMRWRVDPNGGAGAALVTTNFSLVDIDVPVDAGCTPAFGTPSWCFSVTNTDATTANVRATRRSTNATVDVDINLGTTCSNAGATYGLTNGLC